MVDKEQEAYRAGLRAGFAACRRIVCEECAMEQPAQFQDGTWWHGQWPCDAATLRDEAEEFGV